MLLYLRCLLIVEATHRNSLMSGSGRHFTTLWGFSSVVEEVLALSTCFSFCPRLVNHSTWSRPMMALSSCWSRFLRRMISTDFCRKHKTDWRDYRSNMNDNYVPFFNHLYHPGQEPTALGEVVSCSGHTGGLAQHPDYLCLMERCMWNKCTLDITLFVSLIRRISEH